MIKQIPKTTSWPKQLHLHEERYHGSGFEGNECRKLLNNVDVLRKILKEEKQDMEGQKFLQVFQSFQNLTLEYSRNTVDISTLKRCVQGFRVAWKASGMSLTTKAHIVLDHLIPFVTSRGGKNMEVYAEQAHESLHSEYEKTWARYAVKETTNPMYSRRFLASVNDFHSGLTN